jgi:predicted transposase
MKMVLKLQLLTDKETDRLLRETAEQYRQACNHIAEVAFITGTFDQFDLHQLVYHDTKDFFQLPSQLVVRANAEVCSAYKSLTTQVNNYNDPRNSDSGLRWWVCQNRTQENPSCPPFANATLPSSKPNWLWK